jgi:hypothetical protein
VRSVLPGPKIVFRPVHKKGSANLGKGLANVTTKSVQRQSKGQFEMKLKFVFVSECLSKLLKKKVLRKFSSAPFLPL